MTWDAFISYASEDRIQVAQPLAEKLKEYGLKIWYDKFELRIGDSLREKIDTGLASSRFGIIIISKYYFQKPWPKMELEGLIQKEVGGSSRILPIWHNISQEEILKYSPILAGKYAGNTKNGIDALADEILPILTNLISSISKNSRKPITIAFKKLMQNQELHRYSLIFNFKLNTLSSIYGYKLILSWPKFIRIVNIENIKFNRSFIKESLTYDEFIIENDVKVYPGEKADIVSPEGDSTLEYEFDYDIFKTVHSNDIFLYWQFFIHDQMPIEGKKNFRELNFY